MQCKVKDFRENTSQVCISQGFLELIFDLLGFLKLSPLPCFGFLPFYLLIRRSRLQQLPLCSDAVEAPGSEVFGGCVQG